MEPKIIDIFIIKIPKRDKINIVLLKYLKTNLKKSYSIKKFTTNKKSTNFLKSIENSKILKFENKNENINRRVIKADKA